MVVSQAFHQCSTVLVTFPMGLGVIVIGGALDRTPVESGVGGSTVVVSPRIDDSVVELVTVDASVKPGGTVVDIPRS